MNRLLMLEDFAAGAPQLSTEPLQPAPLQAADESASLQAYETGYKNGWADCAVAEAEERKSVGADLAKRLREVELTHASARKEVFASLAPFFEELVATMLPRLAAEAVAPVAVAELNSLLEGNASADVQILAAPGSCETLQRLIDSEGLENVSIHAEPAFTDSQVSVRVDGERREIDLSEVTGKITQAVRAFQSQSNEYALAQGVA